MSKVLASRRMAVAVEVAALQAVVAAVQAMRAVQVVRSEAQVVSAWSAARAAVGGEATPLAVPPLMQQLIQQPRGQRQ